MLVQGIARHSEAEINELLADGLAALSILLGEHKFLLGGAPCVADAAAFGFLDKCARLPPAPAHCACMRLGCDEGMAGYSATESPHPTASGGVQRPR